MTRPKKPHTAEQLANLYVRRKRRKNPWPSTWIDVRDAFVAGYDAARIRAASKANE